VIGYQATSKFTNSRPWKVGLKVDSAVLYENHFIISAGLAYSIYNR